MIARLGLGLVALFFLAGASAGCAVDDASSPSRTAGIVERSQAASAARPEIDRALETLRREETELRARTDFEKLPPSSRSLGSNPYAIVALPGLPAQELAGVGYRSVSLLPSRTPNFAGVLRGDSKFVLLDLNAKQVAEIATVRSPNSLAVSPDGRLFVAGDIEPRVARYRIAGSHIVADGEVVIPEAKSLRGVVADSRALFVADFWSGRLYSTALGGSASGTTLKSDSLCSGPIELALSESYVGAVCLFDHSIVLFERDEAGLAAREIQRIVHDGPFFGLSLAERADQLYVAAGGVEDHSLDRRDKAFGYVDSFAYLYLFVPGRGLERAFAVNTSELGVVTPKIARLELGWTNVQVTVVGYASDTRIDLEWDGAKRWNESDAPELVRSEKILPGCRSAAFTFVGNQMVCANPLLDAWVMSHGLDSAARRVPSNDSTDPSPTERLGEALFFTTLMAPDVTSAGKRSRFTCETCHFEGGTDGRVHHSGRKEIRVSTRPLLGLFNDAPHFSRAHDPDLTSVSHNEFAVANRGNPIDPWFSLATSRFPWLAELGVTGESVEPLELRRALLAFLARFSHTENPLAVRRPVPRRFSDAERRGSEVFRERCVGCHAARLVARDPSKEVPFERWEELVLSPEGPIVWSNGEYEKTGVFPYVDPKGTQTPSLRRLYLKRPYLTNGSAPTLEALLRAARLSEGAFLHGATRDATNARELASEERAALLAFLQVL